jgi:hypothetical protein
MAELPKDMSPTCSLGFFTFEHRRTGRTKTFCRKRRRAMKALTYLFILVATLGLTLTFSACQKEGPAEKAGEEIDQTMDEAGETLDETMENMQDMMDNAVEDTKDMKEATE